VDARRFAGAGESLEFAGGAGGMKFLLLAGQKLKEPIVRHGPFVMNTKEEITQAFADYKNGYLATHKGEMRRFGV
jgi:redox-sensitive bicupin YhaK (pirin superfamily)